MKYKDIFSIILCLISSVGMTLILTRDAQAQEFSLSLNPQVTSITLPYENSEKTVPLSLRNSSDATLRLRIEVLPIKEIDKLTDRPLYQPMLDLTEVQQFFFRTAIAFETEGKDVTELVLAPKQTKHLNVKVNYNNNQNNSEYYFTVAFVQNTAPTKNPAIAQEITASTNIQGGVGAHFLVSLGNTQPDLAITDFSKEQVLSDPLPTFSLKLKNSSLKHTRVGGKISIYNIIGQKIDVYPIESYVLGKQSRQLILTRRENPTDTRPALAMGYNSAKLEITDDTGRRYQRDINYIALPFPESLIFVILVVAGIFVFSRAFNKASRQ